MLLKKEKYIRGVFDIGLFLKAMDGFFQIIAGTFLLALHPDSIERFIIFITKNELANDPTDKFSNYLLQLGNISLTSHKSLILFLLSHGIIKIIIIIALVKNKLWAYPLGIVVFAIFGIYQINSYIHSHSIGWLILIFLDIIFIVLTWHEYNMVKKTRDLKPKNLL